MKSDVFIETSHVTDLRDAVTTAMGVGAGFPAIVMAYGDAGTGKTRAARSLYAEFGGIYIRAMEGMTQCAFLQEICVELGAGRPHGSARCKAAILQAMSAECVPIFADEADRLHVSRLEDLRDIHDVTTTNLGTYLIGLAYGLTDRIKRPSGRHTVPLSFVEWMMGVPQGWTNPQGSSLA